jgi:thiol:disulfide interchange protein DsbD
VAVRLTMADGWHTYYKDPGDSGLATRIAWTVPEGIAPGPIEWPPYEKIVVGGLVNNGYTGTAVLLVKMDAASALPEKPITLRARVDWLECEETCIPGRADLALTLPVAKGAPLPNLKWKDAMDRARAALPRPEVPLAPAPSTGIGAALLLAFLGGLLLNLMPCVLPVLSIKILSLVRQAAEGGKSAVRNGLAFGAGVVASFWILAGTLLALRAGGERLGWGFQLQSPFVVGALGLLFFLLGLNMLGVYEIETPSAAGAATGRGLPGAFLSGALATAVATPCTAPFMGTALGAALTLPPAGALGVFTSLGVGMAFPYMILSARPDLLKFVPRPGPWMETLKHILGFVLLATIIWLGWVLEKLAGGAGLLRFVAALWIGGLAAWTLGRWGRFGRPRPARVTAGIAAVFLVAGALAALPRRTTPTERPAGDSPWRVYSPELVRSLHDQAKPYFIDFTAAWCLSCQINERTVLGNSRVLSAFQEGGVTLVKADWTQRDAAITRALHSYGRDGVPLYVLERPGRPPRLLPALLTPEIVLNSLQESKGDTP